MRTLRNKFVMSSVRDFAKLLAYDVFRAMVSAYENWRFPHASIVISESKSMLSDVVAFFAQKILNTENFETHADFFKISPSGAMKLIAVDDVRELIRNIQSTPLSGDKKFVVIDGADCLNVQSGNALLKIIEEPPADTIIFLTTTKQYDILPTISSRCFHFKLHAREDEVFVDGFDDWLKRLTKWLNSVYSHDFDKKSQPILQMYDLLCGIDKIIADNVKSDAESSFKRELQMHILKKIEQTIGKFCRENLGDDCISILPSAISSIEDAKVLVEFNLTFTSAVESLMLKVFSVLSGVL